MACSGQGEHQKGLGEETLDLQRVMGHVDWVNFNAQSLMERVGETQLLLHMHRHQKWSLADTRWRSQLLPEGFVIKGPLGPDIEGALVIRSYNGACLLWPCSKVAAKHLVLDFEVKQLCWHIVETLEPYVVFTTSVLSLANRFFQNWVHGYESIIFEVRDSTPLLEFQAKRGFTSICEACLQCLCDELEVTVSNSDAVPGQGHRDLLALSLVAHILPETTEQQALEIFLTSYHNDDDRGQNLIGYISDDLVEDVLLVADQETTKEFVKERKKAVEAREVARTAIKLFVKQKFGKIAGQSKPRKQTKSALKAEQDARQRWVAKLKANPEHALTEGAPPSCHVCIDNSNGRFFVTHPKFGRKSISWTVRTPEVAAQLALTTMWKWHHTVTDEEPPLAMGLSLS